jgi:hypothetical protein
MASALVPVISPRTRLVLESSTASTTTPFSAASRRIADPSGSRNEPPR